MTRIRIYAAALFLLGLATSAAAQDTRQTYIVQLADAPAASYRGTLPGYTATQPVRGAKLNVNASHVQAYISYLDAQRNNVAVTINPAAILHRYTVAFNGFSARLTPAEAKKLSRTPGVVAVHPDLPLQMDTTRTPSFLGVSNPGGLWSMTDASGRLIKGENVIIGIVDGGIWPENPSFSDKVSTSTGRPVPYYETGTQVYGPPPAKWKGSCQAGQGFTTAMCNNKLIGAQFFNTGFLAQALPFWPTDYVGPRDESGHGSHTSSTAGGNEGADGVIFGTPVGQMSGIAPRARLAMYRVCWSYKDPANAGAYKNSCFQSDSVAAINKAVADGVDVINYSISGTQTNYLDPVEVAFFNATAAGVFVATSGGNTGPANTVAHMSPWLTTVAASTHDRFLNATVTLGNGSQFSGPSYQTSGVPSTPLILAQDAGVVPFASMNAADQAALSRCYNASDRATLGGPGGVLDPAKVAGKMVVCIRGGNVLINKADAAKIAGASAMIIQNTPATANTTIFQPYVIPTVHLDASASAAVLAYGATPGATASFSPGAQVAGVIAPVMADFSSRGPSLADKNVLKPDISAPGVDIIAAFVAENSAQQAVHDAIVGGAQANPGTTSIQGTSMASPHVAGSAALLRQLHPTWSPAAIKSALMTGTNDIKLANGALDPNRFGYGAGHLNPNNSADPGLYYDAGPIEYIQFLCGVGSLAASSANCVNFGSVPPWNLNLPSLTAANVLGKLTFTRTVTNASANSRTFTASASLPGYDVVVSPNTLMLGGGASATFEVKLARTTATVGTWTFGNLAWNDGQHVTRSPITARASLFASPAQVDDTRTAGTKAFTVGTGYEGTLTATPIGLVPATRNSNTIVTNGFQCYNFAVPAGAGIARFRLYNADTQGGAASDLDLEVYNGPNGTGTLVGLSGSGTSDEQVDLVTPAAGTYSACVAGFAPLGGSATYTMSSWIVGPAVGVQTLKAMTASKVYLGGAASVVTSWSVPAGNRYLGQVQFKDGTNAVLGTSLIAVDVH